MADEFKWIANKFSLVGTPLEDQFPNFQGLNTNTFGFGFNGLPKAIPELDVTNYEVVNTYDLKDLLPFYWNFRSFTATARAEIPLLDNESDKDDVDLSVGGTFVSPSNREPEDRITGNGFSESRSATDNFFLQDLDDGEENPEFNPDEPEGPDNPFWLREPNDDQDCRAKVAIKGGGINTIYRCVSGGAFIGYSFKELVYAYAKSSLTGSGRLNKLNVHFSGSFGLIEDTDNYITDNIDIDFDQSMSSVSTKTTSQSSVIYDANTSISVTVLDIQADYIHFTLPTTPQGDETAIFGIGGECDAIITLGAFSYHTYT